MSRTCALCGGPMSRKSRDRCLDCYKATRARPAVDRVVDRVTVDSSTGCWIYNGPRPGDRYGIVAVNGSTRVAHRVTYEHFVGPVADGLELDHLCRVPACCNPDHLEPVTHQENVRRHLAASGLPATCPHGHEFTLENTLRYVNGSRRCRECNRVRSRRRREAAA